MSFERRNFLSLLGLSASAAALRPFGAVWVDDDLYVNRRLGLRLSKPNGWCFLSLRQINTSINEQQLVCTDEEFLSELREDIGLPLLSISRSISQDIGGPQIDVWVQPNDDEDFPVVETHHLTYETVYAPLLRDFSFEESPHPVSYIGHTASTCVVRFTYENKNGAIAPLRLRSMFFPHGDVSYTINMADNAVKGWDSTVTTAFDSLLASVEFVSSPRP
jgi:hypothetical protein